jgi:hypothetical protein
MCYRVSERRCFAAPLARQSAFLALLFACLSGSAQSQFTYSAALSGANVRPLPDTPSLAAAVADISLEIFPSFTTITWRIRWDGLSGLPVAATLRGPAEAEGPGPVLFSLGNFFTDSTAESGGYAGFRQVADSSQARFIQEGLAYIDIRTPLYPDGEIRGQLIPIPETGTLVFVSAAGAILLMGRQLLRKPR